jgi:hypothetical protein
MSHIGQMSGERTDARKADGRSERQTDGEDQQQVQVHPVVDYTNGVTLSTDNY